MSSEYKKSKDANLRGLLDYFQLTNIDLAKATDIDPSLISRYLSGSRKLRHTSKQAADIAEFLLTKADTLEKIDWIKNQFAESGLSVDSSSVTSIKKNLIAWISTDGENLEEELSEMTESTDAHGSELKDGSIKGVIQGKLAIISALNEILRSLPKGESVDVFLSSDRIRLFSDGGFSAMFHDAIETNEISVNVVVSVSGNTQRLSKIINEYMGEMILGTMRYSTFFGTAQNVAEQMFIVFRNKEVVMITEPPFGSADPIGTFIDDDVFVEELCQSFDATYRYSQPVFAIYDDNYMRNMLEVLFTEYCVPGALGVIKDSINPIYMDFDGFHRIFRNNSEDDEQYAWRVAEHRRFKEGFISMLKAGMPCREIISLDRLRRIVTEEKCQMAGLYFLVPGTFDLDLQGCRDILSGYIDHIETYPNVSILVLDQLPELHDSNCWHVKKNNSVAINDWNGPTPIMCHSTHPALVQEFEKHYDAIWAKGSGSLGNRAYVISILQGIIKEIDEKLSKQQ